MTDLCYLCGDAIEDDASRDHVPPLQFFAPPIRATVNLDRLVTLPAHGRCNAAYGLDEEYFAWSLAPLAEGTTAADAINAYNASKFKAGRSVALGLKTLREFQNRPGGLFLPSGLVIKRIEGARIKRVAWKIVRGLHRLETGQILPERTVFAMELIAPERRDVSDLDDLWEAVKSQSSKGIYKGVFDYKYLDAQTEDARIHGWGMLLWDRIMIFVGHLHPGTAREAA